MIQVIHRALNILEIIARNPEKEWSLSEIANELELNHGTCANIIKTLLLRGYVEQKGPKKGYKLGYMAYQLTFSNEYNTYLINMTKNYIDRLKEKLNETVILAHIKNGKRILIYESLCNQDIQIRTTVESSAYRATTGRILLSHYSPKELKDFISLAGLPSKEEWPEITTESELIQALEDIRNKDIEITHNSNHVVGLATPILKDNKVIASLGIYLPDIRFSKKEQNNIVRELLYTTKLINLELSKI